MFIDGGTLIGVALIILLIFLLVRGRRRRHRIFRRAGFEALPLEGNELVRVAETMAGLPAMDIHHAPFEILWDQEVLNVTGHGHKLDVRIPTAAEDGLGVIHR